MRILLPAFLAVVSLNVVSLSAQVIPGQFPGQDPNRGPMGGAGIPNPFPHKKKAGDAQQPTVQTGLFFDREDNGFAVQLKDKRIQIFQVNKDTKFTGEGGDLTLDNLAPGDEVEVQSKAGQNNDFFALSVKRLKKAAAGSSAVNPPPAANGASANSAPEPPPTVLQAESPAPSGEEAQPRLRRGKPKPRPQDDALEKEVARDAQGSQPAPAPQLTASSGVPAPSPGSPTPASEDTLPPPPPSQVSNGDAFLAKARGAVGESLEKLPNFICEQYTTRYVSDRRPAVWMPQDVLSAKVIYEDGKESYQDLKVNNHPVKDPAKTHNGAWSTGEFGSLLRDLFDPATAASFHSGTNTTLNGRDSRVYDFEVEQTNSHWKVMPDSQYYFPAYTGSIWFDKTTGRALRVEIGAVQLPKEFPIDTVESAVDYDIVTIGSRRPLLPVKAEILSCERNSTNCSRNVIEFRNYHQFGSETEIKIGP
ncbi:MAG TPA: hypothetical protein VHD76_22040 [Bryobacteraceae bacterium]|jgi:hypothetical protein|nr:hypothetical protein [Bryobacteraceae bacterium]